MKTPNSKRQAKSQAFKRYHTEVTIKDEVLHVKRTTVYVLKDSEIEESSYPLKKVDEEELLKIRSFGKPVLILKINDELFFTYIPKKFRASDLSFLGEHLCGLAGRECAHLSAAKDCDGGCAKVRDLSYYDNVSEEISVTLEDSKRIERYNFIRVGFEILHAQTTSNHHGDMFVVAKCDNYEPISK